MSSSESAPKTGSNEDNKSKASASSPNSRFRPTIRRILVGSDGGGSGGGSGGGAGSCTEASPPVAPETETATEGSGVGVVGGAGAAAVTSGDTAPDGAPPSPSPSPAHPAPHPVTGGCGDSSSNYLRSVGCTAVAACVDTLYLSSSSDGGYATPNDYNSTASSATGQASADGHQEMLITPQASGDDDDLEIPIRPPPVGVGVENSSGRQQSLIICSSPNDEKGMEEERQAYIDYVMSDEEGVVSIVDNIDGVDVGASFETVTEDEDEDEPQQQRHDAVGMEVDEYFVEDEEGGGALTPRLSPPRRQMKKAPTSSPPAPSDQQQQQSQQQQQQQPQPPSPPPPPLPPLISSSCVQLPSTASDNPPAPINLPHHDDAEIEEGYADDEGTIIRLKSDAVN